MMRVVHMISCCVLAVLAGCSAATLGNTQSKPTVAVGNWTGQDWDSSDSLAPARDLLATCEAEAADPTSTSGECSFYLAGVFEALALENMAQLDDAQKRTCPPTTPVGVVELRRIFIDYGRSHQDQLDEHRIWTVSAALNEAYPCR